MHTDDYLEADNVILNARFLHTIRLVPLLLSLSACESDTIEQTRKTTYSKKDEITAKSRLDIKIGRASYYADSFNGRKTASGDIYDKQAFTAAHRALPFGTKVKVTYLKTGRSVKVLINDRGPHIRGRIIDLSGAAAKNIGLIDAGHGKIELVIIEP